MDGHTLSAYVETIDEVNRLVLEENIVDHEIMSDISLSWTNNLKNYLTESSGIGELSDELNEDTSFEDSSSNENEKTNNFMMCLYEKINKVKTRWKCFFKRGYVNIDNRDYVFSSALGDLEW